MPRFFIAHTDGVIATVSPEDTKHITTVLRARAGDTFTLCDGAGWDYAGTLTPIADGDVTFTLADKTPSKTESTVAITLFQALPKGDKMDFICEKATELGVAAIVPFQSEFCVSRPDARSAEKKVDRWQKKMVAAAKQSGRGAIPNCTPVQNFKQMVHTAGEMDACVCFYEKSDAPLSAILADKHIHTLGVIVGAEGGFSPAEIDVLTAAGVPCATLGPRILRCETAAVAALTLTQYITGNLG